MQTLDKIPVTILTGFLGSGKTTVIRQLLQNPQGKRIAVVVNEFGEVGIDGELLRACQACDEDLTNTIVELTNGCLCCTVQDEFLPAMQQLLQRRKSLDRILIETSGLALPKPLVQAFQWPEIRNSATVDAVIVAVDCEALAAESLATDLIALERQRKQDPSFEHETPLEELFRDQLICADLVLLTKTDRVLPQQQQQVRERIRKQIRPGVGIVNCAQGQVQPEIFLGFNAAVKADLDHRPNHHEDDHEHDERIQAISLSLPQAFYPEKLVETLRELGKQNQILRVKGFVVVPNKPMRLVLQGVGQRFDHYYDRLWNSMEPRATHLVLIGQDLEDEQIRSALRAIAVEA